MNDTTPKDQPPKPAPTDFEKNREDAVKLWEEREREASRMSTESLHEALEKLPDAPNRESIRAPTNDASTPSSTLVPRPENSPYSAADEERDAADYLEARTAERLKRKAEAPKEK